MDIKNIPFVTTDWSQVDAVEHQGQTGFSRWKSLQFGDINVHMVEYSKGYRADHWCHKGHILFCIEGELNTELKDGRSFSLKPGMTYQVADNYEPHLSSTTTGAKLFIVD